jgi:8-oxo-dGTP diphosphatase
VFKVLARHMPATMVEELPDTDPYLSPGEMLVLQMPRNTKGRAVSCEIITPFDD